MIRVGSRGCGWSRLRIYEYANQSIVSGSERVCYHDLLSDKDIESGAVLGDSGSGANRAG